MHSTAQHPSPLPGILGREAPIHPACCSWQFLLPPDQAPSPGSSHYTPWLRCCACSATAQQLFISSPHLDPIAACSEKSHRARELGESPFLAGAGRAAPWPGQEGHPAGLPLWSTHLPPGSLSPTREKWAPGFQQYQEITARIRSSPGSFPLSLPVFIAICSGLFFQK